MIAPAPPTAEDAGLTMLQAFIGLPEEQRRAFLAYLEVFAGAKKAREQREQPPRPGEVTADELTLCMIEAFPNLPPALQDKVMHCVAQYLDAPHTEGETGSGGNSIH